MSFPSLFLLSRGNRVITGSNEIQNFLTPPRNVLDDKKANIDPVAYSFGGSNGFIVSDTFSYIDTPPLDLEAKGNGGMRILHNYATIDYVGEIETPPDTYSPDIVKDGEHDKIETERKADLKI